MAAAARGTQSEGFIKASYTPYSLINSHGVMDNHPNPTPLLLHTHSACHHLGRAGEVES